MEVADLPSGGAPLLGEPLPIELGNTAYAVRGQPREGLETVEHLAAWLRDVRSRLAIPLTDADLLDVTADDLRLALGSREAIRRLAAGAAAGHRRRPRRGRDTQPPRPPDPALARTTPRTRRARPPAGRTGRGRHEPTRAGRRRHRSARGGRAAGGGVHRRPTGGSRALGARRRRDHPVRRTVTTQGVRLPGTWLHPALRPARHGASGARAAAATAPERPATTPRCGKPDPPAAPHLSTEPDSRRAENDKPAGDRRGLGTTNPRTL